MNYWIGRSDSTARFSYPYFNYSDPGGALGLWRTVKLERGLVRHPSAGVRVPACRELLELSGWGQDECWELLSDSDRAHLHDGIHRCCSPDDIAAARRQMAGNSASCWWTTYGDRESRRLLTAVNNKQLRTEFCHLYTHEYPGDTDTGCPADQPAPATIVSERGDLPLPGPWPR
jgi:hypothetical protein